MRQIGAKAAAIGEGVCHFASNIFGKHACLARI